MLYSEPYLEIYSASPPECNTKLSILVLIFRFKFSEFISICEKEKERSPHFWFEKNHDPNGDGCCWGVHNTFAYRLGNNVHAQSADDGYFSRLHTIRNAYSNEGPSDR